MGSVYKRGKSWYAERTLGYRVDDDGKMRRQMIKKGGFPTKKAAIEYLPQLVSAAAAKKPITFSQMYDAREPTHQATKSTMDCYRAAYKYFKPVWHFPFDQIDIDDLQACMDECDKGKRTRQNMKALCGLLYKYAIPRRAATINMGQYLIVGSGETLERCGIPLEDLRRLENAVGQIKYADYVVAQCYLGFRPSELLALDVLNYDRKGKTFQGGAKTEAGKNRIVPAPNRQQFLTFRSGCNSGCNSAKLFRIVTKTEDHKSLKKACFRGKTGLFLPFWSECRDSNSRPLEPHSLLQA